MTKQYNLRKIRSLLNEGFDTEELRRFSHDELHFRPVHDKLAPNTGKATIADYLIEYATQKLQIEAILVWAKETNPAMYEKYEPYYGITKSYKTQQQIAQKERKKVAEYFEKIADALLGIEAEFEKGQIPYTQGHIFEGLIKDYKQLSLPYLGDTISNDLERLQDLLKRIKENDAILAQDIIADLGGQSELLKDIQRVAGDLRAKAIKIKLFPPTAQ
jgi:hypothetical protein